MTPAPGIDPTALPPTRGPLTGGLISCALREARLKVSSTFSKVAGCRGGALARAPQSAELPCALISAGGGLRGNPRRGFPLYLLLRYCALYACAADCIRIKIPRHLLHCGRRGDTFSGQGSAEKRRAAPARSPGHGASRPRAARAALPA